MTGPSTPVLPHVRLSWGGDLGSPAQDIWTNAVNFRVTGEAPSNAEFLTMLPGVANLLKGLIESNSNAVSPAAALNWVKLVYVLNTGKQRDTNTALYSFPANAVAVGAGQSVPWFQTYAVTLRTALDRGRGHAGRIFPPPSGGLLAGKTPYADAGFANNLAAVYAGTLSAIRASMMGVLNPGLQELADAPRKLLLTIVSRATEKSPVPLLTDVTRIVVDRVADVQHRRTNRVPRNEGTTVEFPQNFDQ